jgi:hypothetical protein
MTGEWLNRRRYDIIFGADWPIETCLAVKVKRQSGLMWFVRVRR